MSGIVVVGAGQAGASLVAKLRTLGYSGELTLFGEEPALPYQRPPLSKAYLMGEMEEERLYLRPERFYEEQAIALQTDAHVTAIDPAAKSIALASGTVEYNQLALTTGSIARCLPDAIGGSLSGVYTVRTLADVDSMRHEFSPGRRVLVIGGGYIGLEAAAVAAKQGLDVTLIEAANRILQRVASPATSDFFRDLHRSHGVDIREDVGLETLIGDARVTGAHLTDGTEIEADFVICGIGIRPSDDLAEAAGLEISNGIAVDEFGRTSDPFIWSAGDCASFPFEGHRTRLESVQNAIDQAETVAANMLGAEEVYQPTPWFWSDQYDVKLQIAGLNTGYDSVVKRPCTSPGSASFWYYRGSRLIAVDAMNDPRTYMIGKRLIEAGMSPEPDKVVNPETNLKSLLKG